jgi:putative ABC transport system permease protein
VTVLAFGIGGTSAIFSLVNTLLLKPLPIPEPDRLVVLTTNQGESDVDLAASPAMFAHWRRQTDVLRNVAAFNFNVMNYAATNATEQWQSVEASAELFRAFGIRILRGRAFSTEEDLPNGPRVAVISEGLWKRRFAADPQMLGRKISLNGAPYIVVGIAAGSPVLEDFEASTPTDVYVPFQLDPNSGDQGVFFEVVARLQPRITLVQAKARLQASTSAYRARFPDGLGPKRTFGAAPLRNALVGDARRLLLILLGAVGLVLLIACANVANLLLVRAAERRREFAIRVAIGAGRGAIIRGLLTESLVLSGLGGIFGLLLGLAGMRALVSAHITALPMVGGRGEALSMDWRVTGFAIAVSLLTGIVFGLFPALEASRVDLQSLLRNGLGRPAMRARALLVISEVSLAVVLLVGSALLLRSFSALYAVNRGFDSSNVLSLDMLLTGPKYSQSANVWETIRTGLDRVGAVPGVVAAAETNSVPLQGDYEESFTIAEEPPIEGKDGTGWAAVSPGFFDVFRIPLKRGRTFTGRDDAGAPQVAVINEKMARQYWKDRDPLQSRIVIGRGEWQEKQRQIVGIVGDVRDLSLDVPPRPIMYVPTAQLTDKETALYAQIAASSWVVRTQLESRALIPAVREQLRQATGLPAGEAHTMDQILRISTNRQRLNMLLMTIFGITALLLAAIGIYGLMAYTVEQRTQEIGIRLALGAQVSEVRNMVARQGMRLAFAGTGIGVAGAWALARLLDRFLFGVQARDPLVFVAVPAVLLLVALGATWFPARRASRMNLADSLRYD